MSSARWWAGESDAIRMTPYGDPGVDLGSAFLALHQAGAKACEDVSRGTIPSEPKLIAALIKAREEAAGPVVDLVAKALGNSAYAGLLVRDIADDAETAALTLYRAIVAKGVVPTLAIERVGLVYGLPRDEMGRYAALAAVPGTAKVALIDTADRALMAYGAELVATEASEPVNKAVTVLERPRTAQYTDFEQKHPRDDLGQFAALATPMVSVPDLATTMPEVGTAPAKPKTLTRLKRLRRLRTTPAEPEAKAELKVRTKGRSSVGQRLRTKAIRTRITSKAITEAIHKWEPPDDGSRQLDPLKRWPDASTARLAGFYTATDVPLTILVPTSSARAILRQTDRGLLRTGALTDSGHMYAHVYVPGTDEAEIMGDEMVSTHLMSHPVYAEAGPPEQILPLKRFGEGESPSEKKLRSDAIESTRADIQRRLNSDSYQTKEPEKIVLAHVENEDVIFTAIEPDPKTGELPSLTRFEIASEDAQAFIDEGSRYGVRSYTMDPNQVWQAVHESLDYDSGLGVPVDTYRLIPLPESVAEKANMRRAGRGPLPPIPFTKAATAVLEGTDRAFFNRVHPRDEIGQFAEVAAPTLATARFHALATPMSAAPSPPRKLKRLTRLKRQSAPAPTQVPAPARAAVRSAATTKVRAKLAAKGITLTPLAQTAPPDARTAITEALVARPRALTSVQIDADYRGYHLILGDRAARLTARLEAGGNFMDPGKKYRIKATDRLLDPDRGFDVVGGLSRNTTMSGLEAATELQYSSLFLLDRDDHPDDLDPSERPRFPITVGRIPIKNIEDVNEVSAAAATAFLLAKNDARVSEMDIKWDASPAKDGSGHFLVVGEKAGIAPILVIEDRDYLPPSFPPGDQGVILTYVDTVPSDELWPANGMEYYDPTPATSTPVHVFRMGHA